MKTADREGMMATTTPTEESPLAPPKDQEPGWQEKVARAKEAREAAKTLRTGKAPVFTMNWSLPQVSQ